MSCAACGLDADGLASPCCQALSWNPRIFLLHDFLTASECDELIALARPALEASTVVDTATGGGFLSQVRTSSGMFIMDNTPVTRVRASRPGCVGCCRLNGATVWRFHQVALSRHHRRSYASA